MNDHCPLTRRPERFRIARSQPPFAPDSRSLRVGGLSILDVKADPVSAMKMPRIWHVDAFEAEAGFLSSLGLLVYLEGRAALCPWA